MERLQDLDPVETGEWVDSLRAVLHHEGSVRATYLLEMLAEEARRAGIVQPSTLNTPYVNTIPSERELMEAHSVTGQKILERKPALVSIGPLVRAVGDAERHFEHLLHPVGCHQLRIGAPRLETGPHCRAIGRATGEAMTKIAIGQGHDGRLRIGLGDQGVDLALAE